MGLRLGVRERQRTIPISFIINKERMIEREYMTEVEESREG